ncbi:hypothetical protein B0J13DRAFT_533185 [Dactylonectria estremocensis]|uniref:Uncharacterized protein n=1 Tax=Dactylonectria estremocensis TaxID=1079267 RepID=A0A9P9DCL6_9HYPO|nr:hypothetical protein B0J13DRAFT_533185 [Dactylonectria estremocensis]
MGYTAKWIKHHVGIDGDALAPGYGRHPEEAKSLHLFLEKKLTSKEAATAITTLILHERDPPDNVYRLMGFLCEALVDLNDEREKLFNLLGAIQALPPARGIDWSQPRGFGNMWSDLYRLHIYGQDEWENGITLQSEAAIEVLRKHYAETATLEAEMYVRGLSGVTASWGYETIKLINHWRVDVLISGIMVWLKVAGGRLQQELHLEEVENWGQLSTQRGNEQDQENASLPQYWERWAAHVRGISENSNTYSKDVRKLATECYKLM